MARPSAHHTRRHNARPVTSRLRAASGTVSPVPISSIGGTTDAGVVMMRRLLREILEGDVPTAWPKPAGSNGDKPKAQNILAQDSVINVNRRADADEDWDLLTKAGEEITEVVIEGSDRFDDDERVDWIVARIKEIEAKYRG